MIGGRFSSFKALLSCALAPDDASLLFSEDVLKSTPPRPILGAAATVGAADVSREPKFNPPAPPRVVCPNPVGAALAKRLLPSVGAAKDAVVAVVPPRPRAKPVAAGCCGAVEVRTEPNVKPALAVVAEAAGAAVREKGVAEAIGLFGFKARLKPAAAVVAGVPNVRPVAGAAALGAGVLNANPPVFWPKRLPPRVPPRPREGAAVVAGAGVPKEKPPVLAAGALVAVPKENPPPALVAPRVPVPKLKPDIFFYVDKRMNPTG